MGDFCVRVWTEGQMGVSEMFYLFGLSFFWGDMGCVLIFFEDLCFFSGWMKQNSFEKRMEFLRHLERR